MTTEKQPEEGQTVYLPDGRKAEYVSEHNGSHLVRLLHEAPGDYWNQPEQWADEKVTVVHRVHSSEPEQVYGEKTLTQRQALQELNGQVEAAREELRIAKSNVATVEEAAKKYSSVQQAIDFIEGRITHVTIAPQDFAGRTYGTAKVATLDEFLADQDGGRAQGLKLLSLFGTDRDGKCRWGINQYKDGSGMWRTIEPHRSEEEARDHVRSLLDGALAAWRSGAENWQRGVVDIESTLKANPWLEVPDDWTTHLAEKAEVKRQEDIKALREKLTKLENPT